LRRPLSRPAERRRAFPERKARRKCCCGLLPQAAFTVGGRHAAAACARRPRSTARGRTVSGQAVSARGGFRLMAMTAATRHSTPLMMNAGSQLPLSLNEPAMIGPTIPPTP